MRCFRKFDDNALKNGPRPLGDAEISAQRSGRRSLLAALGIGAGVAVGLLVSLDGPANAAAGDNPPPGLLAKIQIATQAFNRTPTLSPTS